MNPLELSKAIGAVTQDDIDKTAAAHGAPRTTVLVRELAAHHRSRLLKHFLALGEEDRLLRFGQVVGDHVIEAYVDSIDFDHDKVFGVYDERLTLIGVGHLAYLRDNPQGRVAEFGVSVSESARGKGIGSALFQRAAMHGRNTKVRTLYMHCLSRNAAMMHIAKKAGMRVQYAYGEADAYLERHGEPADRGRRRTDRRPRLPAQAQPARRAPLRPALLALAGANQAHGLSAHPHPSRRLRPVRRHACLPPLPCRRRLTCAVGTDIACAMSVRAAPDPTASRFGMPRPCRSRRTDHAYCREFRPINI